MDNAQKAIMIGVGLFITIIIISIVLLITNIGTGITDEATDNLGNMTASLQNEVKRQYDNKVLTGAEVKSLFSQYEGNKSFLLVFEVDDNNDGAHLAADLWYNDNGYIPTGAAGVRLEKRNGEMFVRTVNAGGTAITGVSTDVNLNVQTDINSSAQYNTYLIYEGSAVIGVYARLRNNNAAGTGPKGLQLNTVAL